MAQHDYNLANQSGADFRADLNNALAAIVTVNSGATSPSTTFAHQLWVDTANSVLKIRNSANDAWITTGVSITADNTFDINGGTVNGITSFSFSTGSTVTSILDEDDLSSDSATALATQQSIKAYVDSQVGSVDTLAEILLNGNTTGGTDIAVSTGDDITFADSSKAIFGTGGDLEIYHEAGVGSWIKEVGAGDLNIQAHDNLRLQNTASENYLKADSDGAVTLYYDNAAKLATTSSGIDVTGEVQADTHFTSSDLVATLSTSGSGGAVYLRPNGQTQSSGQAVLDTSGNLDVTGTVTSDALTVQTAQGDISINNSSSTLNFARAGASYIRATNSLGHFNFITGANNFTNKRLQIASNGDISFYDDTGTTQGLFWDASVESLGIGTTSPNSQLNIKGTTGLLVESNGSANYGVYVQSNYSETMGTIGALSQADAGRDGASISFNDYGRGIVFKTNEGASNAEAARFDSSGRLLVGKTAAGHNTRGVQIESNGLTGICTNNTSALFINRKNGDGVLVELKRDNTTVGSIESATNTNTDISIGSDNVRLLFFTNGSAIVPRASSNASADNTIDLGNTGNRFKDLHLSGNAQIGSEINFTAQAVNSQIKTTTSYLEIIGNTTDTTDGARMWIGNGQSDQGWYSNAANYFWRDTSSSTVMYLNAGNGRLGIGTTSPNNKLTVSGASDGINIVGTNSFVRWNSGNMMIRDEGSYAMGFHTYDGSTGQVERMRITSAGEVLVGTTDATTPSTNAKKVVVGSTTNGDRVAYGLNVIDGATNYRTELFLDDSNATYGLKSAASAGNVAFTISQGSTEQLRVDTSGNLLVGKSNASTTNTVGHELDVDGHAEHTVDGTTTATALILNRKNSDGVVADFKKDGSTVGSIGTESSNIVIDVPNTGNALIFEGSNGSATTRLAISNGSGFESFRPFNSASDDLFDLGSSTRRFKDIYATNGTIQTSDINEKQDIEDLSEAEIRVAVAAKGLLKKYRWKSAVADKGDDARIHFGIMAQDLKNAFANEGLDAGDYGMFISTTWTDEATGEEKTRLGVRYNELLAFIIAAI